MMGQHARNKVSIMTTAIVYGPASKLTDWLTAVGVWPKKWHPDEGPFPGPKPTGFTGGYDDYGGSWAWLEVDASLIPSGAMATRFSPDPGRWVEGFNVRDLPPIHLTSPLFQVVRTPDHGTRLERVR
jgi:hypothetical protein